MSAIPLVINQTMKYGEWMFDRDLEARDNAACAAEDRRNAIADAVTFADLLEECCEFTGPQREVFMLALARDDSHTLLALLDQAKQTIVKCRLAQGD
jgi:hypothetical protein